MYLGWKLNKMFFSFNVYFSKDMYGGFIILFIFFFEENVFLNFIVVVIEFLNKIVYYKVFLLLKYSWLELVFLSFFELFWI